jgi:uncharacterized membrane protein YsdA (DUF1294 family)
MLLLYIILIVYILAINFYSILLLISLKKEFMAEDKKLNAGDGKLLLAAVLGGAIGIYVTMFITKFKLRNMLLMIALPVIAVINVWIIILAFRSGTAIFVA